ncbi:hypothetical protein MLD38_002552 [Melastoma candidum]|uniref:Uncharacterized protein n=1 Tax=Melastoma candidum TaxID=119954 RepID=A0ACB9RZF6_9MYRT|nr:hypothetical protein MLD38_002552 [Melastoma candidum]
MYTSSKAGRFKDAWNLYEDMDKDGVNPDLLTYNTVISVAYIWIVAKDVLSEKRIKIIQFSLDHMFKNDVIIDLSTYALLVHGLCKSGHVEEACLYFEEMVQKGFVLWVSTSKLILQKLKSMTLEKEKKHIEKLLTEAQQHAM